jgi:ComEC/Rec2-related protein
MCLTFIQRAPSTWGWFYAAILIGQGDGIRQRPEISTFVTLGLYHLIVVSGSHVRAVEQLVKHGLSLVPREFVKDRAKKATVGFALIFFTLANRFDPSCTRAVVAWALTLLPPKLKPQNSLDLQFVVVCLCLIIEPQWAGSLSFQLSCAASLGLTMAAPLSEKRKAGARRLISSFFCTIATAPLVFAFQPCLSWIVVPANTLAMPLFESVLMPAALGASVIPFLDRVSSPLLNLVFSLANWLCAYSEPRLCLEERKLREWGLVYLGLLYLLWRFCLPSLLRRQFWKNQTLVFTRSFFGTSAKATSPPSDSATSA